MVECVDAMLLLSEPTRGIIATCRLQMSGPVVIVLLHCRKRRLNDLVGMGKSFDKRM